MAILASRPGIKIIVVCNGAPLQEYEDDDAEDQDGSVVSTYIEAVSGAEFGVQWEITSPWPPYTILFECWLDQKYSYLHKFAFAALTVDDHGVGLMQDELMEDIKGMGEITVKAFFIKNLKTSVRANHTLDSNLKEAGKIPEKAFKGRTLSHQTFLQAPWPSTKVHPTASCDFVDPLKQPSATYTFKCAQILLLVPRSPSPIPFEERDINTLNMKEMIELLQCQREQDAATRLVKPERGIKREYERERSRAIADDENDISVVSTKRRREQYWTIVDDNGVEAIDLTWAIAITGSTIS
ncbi:hypothetical protein E8E12_003340 [Didymella heteroderae]|uniref:DUF7918 domain-containing protein n=1 Tax=Didymella heteroderae TaxID=1769908 RepID=A0A9P5BZF8_9PLEO|nr:hypothetical protein E8E12_003340 [Didymella heteroderae]